MPSLFRSDARAARDEGDAPPDSSRISPTAHYTGHVWFRNGLSDRALRTPQGAALFAAMRPAIRVFSWTNGGLTLERMLLQRHRIIDHLLADAIERGRVAQVLEIAGGMSGRGLRFARRYADRGLIYVEGDLPGMCSRKRAALDGAGLRGPSHHVVALDVLAASGPRSLQAATRGLLRADRPTAIVTEGLVNYFDRAQVTGMWSRFAALLSGAGGLYLSDLHTRAETEHYTASRLFMRALQVFARGRVHLHFRRPEDARDALLAAGFERARLSQPSDWRETVDALPRTRGRDVLRVVEAWVDASASAPAEPDR